MDKLPKKEDLLPKTTTAPLPQVTQLPDNMAALKAKEAADIAMSKDKQVEAEIRTKLREQGYTSLEEGLKDVEAKKQEANTLLESAQQIEDSVVKLQEDAEQRKDKAIQALEILKQREATINARLQKAIELEEAMRIKDESYALLKKELQDLISYHNTHIAPCVKSLRLVSKSIYSWIDLLNNTHYDFSLLYNYIGKVMSRIDKYRDKMPMSIPSNLLPKEDE